MKNFLIGLGFVFIVSLIAQFLFSSRGFVPSDDGFMLGYSQRIADGEIPFKDFLSAQNIATPILWIPFIYFSGNSVFWVTRFFVWLEFASIAWIWTVFVFNRIFKINIALPLKILLGLFAFFFTVHSFPPMVWYTIDGLFIYTLAIVLCSKKNTYLKTIGYFLVGVTYLTKQNFIFLLPATIFLLADWKERRYWISMLAPVLLFYCFFFIAAGIDNVISQTTSRTEFVQTAIKGFAGTFTFPWGLLTGIIGSFFIQKNKISKSSFGAFLLFVPILYSVYYLHNSNKFVWDASFLLFGNVLGIALYCLYKKLLIGKTELLFLLIITAWCVAISGGYNTPALASGVLFIANFVLIYYFLAQHKRLAKRQQQVLVIMTILLFPIAIASFYYLRTHAIYGEPRPASQVTYSVANVLPGGKRLYTSKEVYERLVDLQNAINYTKKQHLQYAILPSYAAMWVEAKQENPLLMDYPFVFNNQTALIRPLVNNIRQERGKIIIIVDKAAMQQPRDTSSMGVYPIAMIPSIYYNEVFQTKYFVLYR